MDAQYNPILSSPPTVVPLRRNAPSGVKRLILELGLRYRPTAADQLEPFQAKLAALVADCADIPTQHLERAIREWVTQSPYLPKASDLIGMAQAYVRRPTSTTGVEDVEAMLARLNAGCTRLDLEWSIERGNLTLGEKMPPNQHFARTPTATPDEITAYAKKQQASKRVS